MKIYYDLVCGSSVTDAYVGMWQVSDQSQCYKCKGPKMGRWMWRSIRFQKRYVARWIGPMSKREMGRAIRDWAAKMSRPDGCLMVQWYPVDHRFLTPAQAAEAEQFYISIYWIRKKDFHWDCGIVKPAGFPARVTSGRRP